VLGVLVATSEVLAAISPRLALLRERRERERERKRERHKMKKAHRVRGV